MNCMYNAAVTDRCPLYRLMIRGTENMNAGLLLGDEAVAWGAIDAGIAGIFSYAGTPCTEIMETIQVACPSIWSKWSANEKVAYEEALGMSYAGKRALVSMKHVGLNVAADPFMSSSITGVVGGLVLVVGDDPGMHSSQNEQDSRFLAEFAQNSVFRAEYRAGMLRHDAGGVWVFGAIQDPSHASTRNEVGAQPLAG